MAASLVYCGAVPCAVVFAVCSSAFAFFGEGVLTALWLAAAFLAELCLPSHDMTAWSDSNHRLIFSLSLLILQECDKIDRLVADVEVNVMRTLLNDAFLFLHFVGCSSFNFVCGKALTHLTLTTQSSLKCTLQLSKAIGQNFLIAGMWY